MAIVSKVVLCHLPFHWSLYAADKVTFTPLISVLTDSKAIALLYTIAFMSIYAVLASAIAMLLIGLLSALRHFHAYQTITAVHAISITEKNA